MEHEARERQRNRFFITTQETMERARGAIASDIYKLKRTMGERAVEEYVEKLLGGFVDRLFNMPLDMIIEKRLFERHPEFRPSQFASLEEAFRQGARGLNDPTAHAPHHIQRDDGD